MDNSLRRSILALHAAAAERYSNEKSYEKIWFGGAGGYRGITRLVNRKK